MSSVKERLLLPKRKGRRPKKALPKGGRVHSSWLSPPRLLSGWRGVNLRSRVSIRVWLTVLFLLVTAFAGAMAYSIVSPVLGETLEQSAKASFRQTFDPLEEQLQRNPRLTEQYITAYATLRGVQWGIVHVDSGEVLRGDPGEYDAQAVRTDVRVSPLPGWRPPPSAACRRR